MKPFTHPDFPFSLAVPAHTPGGAPVKLDECIQPSGHRLHFTGGADGEVYFELGRYPESSADTARREFEAFVSAPESGGRVRVLDPAHVAGLPAVHIEAIFPEKRRWVYFLEYAGAAYRLILNPDSGLNHAILASLEVVE